MGIDVSGSVAIPFSTPTQLRYILTSPGSRGLVLFIAGRMMWMANRPRSSPQNVLAEEEHSRKEPIILPLPAIHLRTKADEHRLGQNSLM